MGNFIHPQAVKKDLVTNIPQQSPLQLHMVTGKIFYSVTHQANITLVTQHGHTENILLDITPIGKHDIILGLPWCTFHGVQFDWKHMDITRWSPNCERRCFPSTDLSSLSVQLLDPSATPPHHATTTAIGYDLYANENTIIL